ncbi:MAG TPA: nucleotide exchange factor GrpE, partial [Pyrinomonadaceae bacterium]|nr:nucleotide exchange factor GrpE [Pyrinomonadaceae bacterium]
MMSKQKGERKSRTIPVRFLDEEEKESRTAASREESSDKGREPSAEELGRESSYEGETEMQRRIDRGGEDDSGTGRDRADDADVAGGPPRGETPEEREDQNKSNPGGSESVNASASAPQSTTAAEPTGQATGPMMAELVATRAELKRVEAERADLYERLVRRQAEFDNYRKRVERERGETYNRMLGDVARKLLPVLDNLRRALDAEASLKANESEEFRHFLNGVELIYKQLNEVLEGLGVEPVAAIGQPFDPHVHEAVVTDQTEEFEPDTVIQELVRGYRLGDKLLRPAVVKVA